MNIGFDQIGIPAPLFYRRVVNAMVIIIMPAAASLISNIPAEILSDKGKILAGVAASFFLALLKALEYIIGPNETPPLPEDEKPK